MGHHHHHHHHHEGSIEKLRFAFFLNLGFAIFEFFGGIWTNSMAITSDALHDLGDSMALGMSWYFEKYSNKERDNKYSFGYKRFSLVGAVVSSTVLLIGSTVILSESIPRIINPEPFNAKGMLLMSIFGLIVNGIGALKLHNGESYNERMVSLHLLEDVLGWAATLIVSIIVIIKDIPILDPILSVLVTIFVLWNAGKNLKMVSRVFLQSVPHPYSIDKLEAELRNIEGVEDIHKTQLWSLDGQDHVLSTHVVIGATDVVETLTSVKLATKSKLKKMGIEYSTIEIELQDEDCSH